MPCNSGVSLIPKVHGQQAWFSAGGLYNGLVLLKDAGTGSYWDHITGECVHGPLKGTQLEYSDYDLLYMTVSAALVSHPHARLAPSDVRLHHIPLKIAQFLRGFLGPFLPPHFLTTMGQEDDRRARMDLGLGLWTSKTRRYYPVDTIKQAPDGLFDKVDGQSVFIYFNALGGAPDAFYTQADRVVRQDDMLQFNTGECLLAGKLFDVQGQEIVVERPQQMFTRWYGFAFTFPHAEIYGSE